MTCGRLLPISNLVRLYVKALGKGLVIYNLRKATSISYLEDAIPIVYISRILKLDLAVIKLL